MPQTVEIPGVGEVDFPDGMSREDISDRIKNQILPKYRAPRPADSVPVVAPTEDPNAVEAREQLAKADLYGNLAQFAQNLNPAIGIPNAITAALRAVGVPETEAPNITPDIVESTPLVQLPNFTAKNWLRPITTRKGINERMGGAVGTIPEDDPVLNAGLGAYDAAKEFAEGLSTGNMAPALFVGGAPATGAKVMETAVVGSSILGLPDAFQNLGESVVAAEEAMRQGKNVDIRGLVKAAGQAAIQTVIGISPAGRSMWADRASAKWEQQKKAKPASRATDLRVKEAITKAKEEGPSPEFRAFFGGIEPEIVGTTPEKVSAFAKSLGLEWVPPEKPPVETPRPKRTPTPPKPKVEDVPMAPVTTEALKTVTEEFPVIGVGFTDVPLVSFEGQVIDVTPGIEPPRPTSGNPIRDLILSDQTTAEKSQEIRRMAKEQGVSVKEIQEAVEAEIVRIAHEIASDLGLPQEDAFKELVELYNKQPLLSSRTSTSIEHQAYSTPAPLAYAMRHASLTGTKATVYDPTGGTGMLFIGSDLEKSIANELQPGRAQALRNLGVGEVTENDATTFVPERKVSSVHANPPFGSIPNVNYDGFAIRKLEHLITLKALEAMRDNGTAEIVLGANMMEGDTAKGAQWVFENYLYSRYHVADNFEVEGDLYGKQGAKWPVRVIIVAGRRETPLTGELAPQRVDRLSTWDEVWERSERARNEVKRIREGLVAAREPGLRPGAEGGGVGPQGPGTVPERPSPAPKPTGQGGKPSGSGGRKPSPGAKPGGRPTSVAPAEPAERPGGAKEPTVEPGEPGKPPVGVEEGGKGGVEPTPGPAGGIEPTGEGAKPRSVPKPAGVINERQIDYVPRAEGTPFGTLTPGNIGSGTHEYLDALKARVGPLTEFVAGKIGTTATALKSVMASDQIDGVAAAIDQIENGSALVIGDETGIGKGRQAAAVLEYAKHQGKIPVFVTKDPKLFSDMFGDLKDIGGTIKNPLILGDTEKASIVDGDNNVLVKSPSLPKQQKAISKIMEEGFEDSGYDAIFLTYSQVNKDNPRQKFLEALAERDDVIIVMDEAHEAAGGAETSMQASFFQGGVISKGSGADKVEIHKTGLLNQPGTKIGRGGVVYLSATFAKRPDNTSLYFRTDLGKAAQKFSQIVDAMKKGGVALQQAVSEGLAKSGQYFRRERDFSGVKYSMKRVEGASVENVEEKVDDVTDVLRDIIAFSTVLKTRALAAKATAMSEDSMAMTEFSSKVHNTIGQLLLAAKSDAVIDEAVQSFKKGGKPVIALMNTMESFLDDFVEDNGIENGDPIKLTWGDLVKHALSRTLRAKRKLPNGNSEIVIIDPESVGLQAEFDRITKAAEKLDVPFPVSPIDYIVQGIRSNGIKMAELTGRESGIEYTDAKKGEGTYRVFKKANKNTVVNAFNSGAVDGMLLNASGSTGLSAHASTKFKDQRKRDMLIAQPSTDINVFIQTLGRIRRTGMIPGTAEYIHLILPLEAETRPAAMTNNKMKSLNANTTAEAAGSVKIEVDDILNKYGDRIVSEYLADNMDMQIATGIDISLNEDGSVEVPSDVARKFTGRMAVMRNAEQAEVYSHIIPAYKELIEHLKTTGEYDLDIVTHADWDAVLQSDTELTAGTDESSIFTSSVRAQQWEITDNRHVPTGKEMESEFQRNTGGREALKKTWETFQSEAASRLEKGLEKAEENLRTAQALPDSNPSKSASILGAEIGVTTWKKKIERWHGTQLVIDRAFEWLGDPVTLTNEETGDSQEGMMVDVKFPDLSKGLRISPGAFRFNYLVDAPGGRLAVSGSQLASQRILQIGSSRDISDFTGQKKGQRYQRWILTGNPIAAFKNTGGAGKVVRFMTRDGDVVTGLMMPNNWNLGKLASDPRLEFINGTAAVEFLENLPSGSTVPVEIPDGSARVQKNRGVFGISISTPKKLIHLDKELRNIVGDFTKTGNRMLATVYDAATLSKAVDRIMAITGSKFRLSPQIGKGDPRAVGLVSKANEVGKSKPSGSNWSGATSESGFVINPAIIAREIIRMVKTATGYLKGAGRDVIDLARRIGREQFKIQKIGDYRKAILRWSGKQQRSWQEAHNAQRDIQAIFKDKVRDEAAYAWIEAAGDPATLRNWARKSSDPKRKAAYEAALTLNAAELDMVQAVRDTFAELGARGDAEGVLGTFHENYVPHIWEIGTRARGVGGSVTLKERLTHSMARTFATSFEGEQAGFVPRTKRLSEVVPIYINEMNRVIAARQLARDLRKGKASDGEPLVQMQGSGVPVSNVSGSATLVMPRTAKNKSLKYQVIPGQSALTDWIWTTLDPAGNPVFLKADMALHPEAYHQLKNVLGRSSIKNWYQGDKGGATMAPVKFLVKAIDRAQSEYKRAMLGFFAAFHQVQEGTHGIGHRVSPLFRPKIDLMDNPVQRDYVNHGLMLFPDRASQSEFMEGFRISGVISRLPAVGKYADMYSDYLFHVFIPEMKVKTMEAIVARNMEVFKRELASGETTESAVKVLSAEQTNAAYGHLNYADLARSPTVQHFLQLALLAPDFLEARTRFAAQSGKGFMGAKVGREQALALGFLGLSMAAMAFLAGNLIPGAEWDPKHPFEVRVGNRKYTMRSVPEDLMSLYDDWRRFMFNRINPLTGRGAVEVVSKKNWRGEKVETGEIIQELAQGWIPLNVRPFAGVSESSLKPWEEFAGSMGFKIMYFSANWNIFKLAREFKLNSGDPKLVAEAKRESRETHAQSDYTKLRRALENEQFETAKEEYAKLLETKSRVTVREAMEPNKPLTGSRSLERKFVDSLSDDDKKIYALALETRKLIFERLLKMRGDLSTSTP